jgi:hypothetical protein
LVLAGCAARVQHPGTANAFDSGAYDTLLVAHNVIESTKSDISAGVFPANVLPAVKVALNGLVDAYNALDTVYCNPTNGTIPSTGAATLQCSASSYHALAMAGTAPVALQNQVQAAQNNVNSATVALSTAKTGNPGSAVKSKELSK